MSSAPFGGLIRFSQYQEFAIKEGCTVQNGVNTQHGVSLTLISSPSGGWVIEPGTQFNDYLAPTTIGRFDRRLGLVSPFFSVDDPSLDP